MSFLSSGIEPHFKCIRKIKPHVTPVRKMVRRGFDLRFDQLPLVWSNLHYFLPMPQGVSGADN